MFCAPWSTTEQRSSCDVKNRFTDARKVCAPTKSLAIEESHFLRSPERTEAKGGIVYETVLGESWVQTHGEWSSGPWAVPRVCWPSRVISPPETTWLWGWASFCRMENGLASFVSCLKGARLLEHAGAFSLSSRMGTGQDNQSSAALVRGPPALYIGSWLSLDLALAFFLCWQAILSLSSSFMRFHSHTWQWMITQASFSVAYGGSLEIHPQSFQLRISLWHRRRRN